MSLYINNQIVLCCKDSANLGNTKGKRKKKSALRHHDGGLSYVFTIIVWNYR